MLFLIHNFELDCTSLSGSMHSSSSCQREAWERPPRFFSWDRQNLRRLTYIHFSDNGIR